MTDEEWRQAFPVFLNAAEIPAIERRAFLVSSLADPDLIEKLEAALDEEDCPGKHSGYPSTVVSGTRIGRYIVSECIGRGGMGDVYAALDTELNRPVALKFLRLKGLKSAVELDSIVREAKAASGLNHPSIVTVYEVIRAEPWVAIVMELIEGLNLRQLCSRKQPLDRILSAGQQIASALVSAHRHGIIHRDVKPENIICRDDGLAKLLDFGLAQRQSEMVEASVSIAPAGTLRYMSPEQILCKPLTPATDVYSLGVVLCEAISGKYPASLLRTHADVARWLPATVRRQRALISLLASMRAGIRSAALPPRRY